jgi:hypothetical protein
MENKLIKEHLAEYKKEVLNIPQNGIWNKNKKQYAHILPEKYKDKNIINSEYHQKIINEITGSPIKLHSDFHHLNSSQALCFNLFFPVFFEDKFNFLLNKTVHKDTKEKTEKYIFEHIEDKKENTNFDLYVKTDKAKYYFEIKYTEKEFAKVKNDKRYLNKFNSIYSEKTAKFKNVTQEIFFGYYQIFRNLIYDDGYNIFVFPSYRLDLKDTVNYVIKNHCTKKQQERIIILPLEEIVKIMLNCGNDKLIKHYKLFGEKYFLN